MTRPVSFLDDRGQPAPLSDTELLDFLELLGAPHYRIALKARRGWWEMHTTSNQLEGRISVRGAIQECARARSYRPRRAATAGWRGRLAALLGVTW